MKRPTKAGNKGHNSAVIIGPPSERKQPTHNSRQSYVFYRLVDAQLTRLKPGSMVIVTSKDLPLLADHFEERDYFIATMDRILEHFTCFVLQGKAFNGKPKDVAMLKLI